MAHHHSTSTSNAEMLRGRTRDRSSRTAAKPNRTEESSTLRGRSRQRALSPLDTSLSRNPSPSSLLSPTRHLLLYNKLQGRQRRSRNHCPSRAASPNGRRPSQRRNRREPSARRGSSVRDAEPHRPVESFSSLRHELVVTVEAPDGAVEGVQS